ncbi:MAG TPA: glycerophosphodiester phosphodiesterase family protein [Flavobacteriaceae bacterium]|nr:glycerophosphodiester phosphodiesterase family protein [Flavobacteriaceae bacterium]
MKSVKTPMLKSTTLSFFLILIGCYAASSQEKKPSYNYANRNFQAIAHRGYSDIYPENTLLSIEEAFKRGIKYCEIDVIVTSDDVYVLYHDQPTMYRTSNGQGYVVSSTYKELLELDLGSWKGSQFTGTKIATLEEALLLAEKYDGYYYLDTKKFRPDLMGKALKTTGANPKRLMAAIANIEEAKLFKKYCPESPFIYFGGFPENLNDDNWYKEFVDLGCEIFETYYTLAIENDDNFQTFVNKVHQHGAKVWVFTSNNLEEIIKIKEANVDGVESDVAISVMKVLWDNQLIKINPIKATTANFTFDQKNLQSTGIGSQLRPLSYDNPEILQKVEFGKTSDFKIKPINGVMSNVMKVPAFNPQNGLFLFNNFIPNSDEELHYNYSIIIDIYIPMKSNGKFMSLLQTNPENENDGDLFIARNGIGINNNYHGKIEPETWNRVVVTYSKTVIKKYINGKFVGETPIEGGRWSVINTFPGGDKQGFLLFADDDNETAELYVNAIQVRNYTMNSSEITHLGLVKANGIPLNNAGLYDVKLDGELKSSIVNWDNNDIYVTYSKQQDISNVKISFKLPFGATSSIKSDTFINLNQPQNILITAQDGVSKKEFNIVVETK